MAVRKDYYSILGVAKDASEADIKRAYRKLARKVHPDVNPGDPAAEERFKEISEAYHVLGDEGRRRQYDQMGADAFAQQFDPTDFSDGFGSIFGGGGAGGGFPSLEDLLGGLAGGAFGARRAGGRRPPRARRGKDVRVAATLTLEEVLSGGEREVSLRGTDGTLRRHRVRIPATAREGSRVRLSGKGEPGLDGGPPGDLYLEISIAPHDVFRLEGDDLHAEIPVTVYEAALGATIDVPTLEGSSRINLPRATRSGQVLRLTGRGAERKGGGRGDLLVRVVVVLPSKIDPQLEKLMHRFRDDHPYDPRNQTKH